MVQDGDLSKMGLLYERHHRSLFGFFYRLTDSGSQSEDLVQNVFYRLLKYRHAFKNEGKFVYWLYAVARNVSKDVYKKKDPLMHSSELDDMPEKGLEDFNAEEKITHEEQHVSLKNALNSLSEEQREAIVMSKFQGMKYHEIAVIANCTESAIKARIRRGIMEMKRIMDKAE